VTRTKEVLMSWKKVLLVLPLGAAVALGGGCARKRAATADPAPFTKESVVPRRGGVPVRDTAEFYPAPEQTAYQSTQTVEEPTPPVQRGETAEAAPRRNVFDEPAGPSGQQPSAATSVSQVPAATPPVAYRVQPYVAPYGSGAAQGQLMMQQDHLAFLQQLRACYNRHEAERWQLQGGVHIRR
jgi:hypothetical protein